MADAGEDLAGVEAGVVRERPVHDFPAWYPGAPLPAALLTGHQVIDAEHAQLLGNMAALRRICVDYVNMADCRGCDSMTRTRCEGEVIGLLGDLLAFIIEHFLTEEEIMHDSLLKVVDHAVCESHIEDHAAISTKVQEIVTALDTDRMVGQIRELDHLLARWLNRHVAQHDVLLVNWVNRHEFASIPR